MKKLILAVVMMFALTTPACTLLQYEATQKAVVVAVNVPVMMADIDQVTKSLTELQKSDQIFDDEEILTLTDALNTYEFIKNRYDVLENQGSIPSTEEIQVLWNDARELYTSTIAIVKSHSDQIDRKTLYNIEIMSIHASSLDISVQDLLEDPTAQNINRALSIIGTMVSIGAKVAVTAL